MPDFNISKNLEEIFNIISLDITDSTNNEAKRIIAKGEKKPFIVTAKEQTGGRGRQGKSFFSPKDTGLYMTVCFPINKNITDFLFLTAASALSVVEAISSLTGVLCKIKWVNDIYKDEKKICGILAESVLGENPFVIIGIGINLTTSDFPSDIKSTAASLEKEVSKESLVSAIALRLKKYYDKGDYSFIEEYRKHSLVTGRDITFVKNGETHSGKAIKILDTGALLVLTDDKTEEILDSGEISLRLK